LNLMQLLTVTLHGTPFERGKQHGARFKPEIEIALAELKSTHGQAAYGRAVQLARDTWPDLQAQVPAAAAELEGISSGARLALIDILLLSGFEFFEGASATGCSAIAASGPSGALVAQNWDALPSAAASLALFLHFGAAGFEQAIVGSVGGLGWVGCNRHGLAFVNNDLVLCSRGVGLPSQLVRRAILETTSVAAAIDRLKAIRHRAGRSYLLGDSTGAVAGVEVSAAQVVRWKETAPVLHANHALDPDIASDEAAAHLQRTYPSSRHRQSMLQRKAPARPSVQSIATLLCDTEGHPNAIAKTAAPEEPTATLFSVIFDCGARALHLCAGAPTAASYDRWAW
jgi:isopenicillin-N N-acyltransferase-like protein